MRIISGNYRGRRLTPPNLKDTRPTTDFAREGLFNMLTSKVEISELNVLDLFTGTGAVAIEFLSRGAASATAIDTNRGAIKYLAQIKSDWGIENLDLSKGDSIKYLRSTPKRFDLIFADPPYNSDYYQDVLKIVMSRDLIKQNGLLILEHDKFKDFTTETGFSYMRSFGKVNFSFFSAL